MNSAGDTGVAECDYQEQTSPNTDTWSAYPASSQYVTGVGGTSIPVHTTPTSTARLLVIVERQQRRLPIAKGYIPEAVWNDCAGIWLHLLHRRSDSCPTSLQARRDSPHGQTTQEERRLIGIFAGGGGISNCAYR